MKKVLLLLFVFLQISGFSEPQGKKTAIAVLELDGNGITSDEKNVFTNRLRSKLINTGVFTVVERGKMDEILKEQGFQKTGCTSNDCAVEVGQLLNVSSVVTGSVDKIGNLYSVSVRIVDVSTGEITKSIDEDCNGCSIEDALLKSITNAADRLAGKAVQTTSTVNKDEGSGRTFIEYAVISKGPLTETSNLNSSADYIETDVKKIPKLTVDKHCVAFWSFDQTSGDSVKDESGKGHTLLLKGNPEPGAGLNKNAVVFNNNYATTANSADLYPQTITVEAICSIKKYQDPNVRPVAHSMIVSTTNWDYLTYGYELRLRENGKPEFSFGTGTDQWVTVAAPGVLKKDAWYHVAGQFDGDTAKIFVNGQCMGKVAYHGRIGLGTTPFGIARRMVDQPFYFYGVIDEVRISDKARY